MAVEGRDAYKFAHEQSMVQDAYDCAHHWQQTFDSLSIHEPFERLKNRAAAEVNDLYPYKDNPVYASGYGLHPRRDSGTGLFTAEDDWGYSEGISGMHVGFTVKPERVGSLLSYHVMHRLIVATQGGQISESMLRRDTVFDHFDLDSSILNARTVDDALGIRPISDVGDLNQRMGRVMGYSEKLVNLFHSGEFRKLKHARQVQVLQKFLVRANQRSGVEDTALNVTAQYAYVPVLGHSNLYQVPIDLIDQSIDGVCLGLESIESARLEVVPIRSKKDLVDGSAGICLVIDPDSGVRKSLSMQAQDVLYVPMSSQDFRFMGKIARQ